MSPVIRFPKKEVLNSIKYKKYRKKSTSIFNEFAKNKVNFNKIKYNTKEIQKILKEKTTLNELRRKNPQAYSKFIKYVSDNVDLRIKKPQELINKLVKFHSKLELKLIEDPTLSKNVKQKEKILNDFIIKNLDSKEQQYIKQFRRMYKIQNKLAKTHIISNAISKMALSYSNSKISHLVKAIDVVYKDTIYTK
jgi:hypothetical protein